MSISLIIWPFNNVYIDQNITIDLKYIQIYMSIICQSYFLKEKMHVYLCNLGHKSVIFIPTL